VPDENQDALRTPLGRERMLEDHETRIDKLEGRMSKIEGKEASRDKRSDYVMRAIFTIGTGIVIAVISGLIASGAVHP
jgi:hypothetical protein